MAVTTPPPRPAMLTHPTKNARPARRTGRLAAAALAILLPFTSPLSAAPSDGQFKNSWIRLWTQTGAAPSPESTVYSDGVNTQTTHGQAVQFTVHAEYHLDAADKGDSRVFLAIDPLLNWPDIKESDVGPDGTIYVIAKAGHREQPETLHYRLDGPLQAGTKTQSWTWTIDSSKIKDYVDAEIRAQFFIREAHWPSGETIDAPWRTIIPGPVMVKSHAFYDLRTAKPGNLFHYADPVQIRVFSQQGAIAGEAKTLDYTLTDAAGNVSTGSLAFTAAPVGSAAIVTIPVTRRGTFFLETNLAGWGERSMYFARIPNVRSIVGQNTETKFSVTRINTAMESEIAHRIGFSWVRHFFNWAEVHPRPGVFEFARWDRVIDANLAHGLKPWLMLVYPPHWAQRSTVDDANLKYQIYDFDPAALEDLVVTASDRYRNKIWGWEWQNESIMGSLVNDPGAKYFEFVETASTASRAVAPHLKIQLAGGLWPRSFRQSLLNLGILDHIDVLPIHYADQSRVIEAEDDLASMGELGRVEIWDNETATQQNQWNRPRSHALTETKQAKYVLTNVVDSVSTGVKNITYFGGQVDATGDWSYLLDLNTPRPVATTLAVMIAKLHGTTPLGKFTFDDGGIGHLFVDQWNRSILVLSSGVGPRDFTINVNASQIKVTDYQGNETTPATVNGRLTLALTDMPVFVEGGTVSALKSYLGLKIGGQRNVSVINQVTAVEGQPLKVAVTLHNTHATAQQAEVKLRKRNTTQALLTQTLPLAAGERRVVELLVPGYVGSGNEQWLADFKFLNTYFPTTESGFLVNWVNPAKLGNQLANGDLELGNTWGLQSYSSIQPTGGALGTQNNWLLHSGRPVGEWMVAFPPRIPVTPGQTLLYSGWMLAEGLDQGGSSIEWRDANNQNVPGTKLDLPKVFETANDGHWHYLAVNATAPAGAAFMQVVPSAKKLTTSGFLRADNLRVTFNDTGSLFATEAFAIATPPTIDGNLADWSKTNPIPLLGRNQVQSHNSNFTWTPAELSAVAYTRWDANALYLAVEVIDDTHATPFGTDQVYRSDSVILGIQPVPLGNGTNDRGFALHLSARPPGGGSGQFTLYRPADRAGGLSSGQLAEDSSIYDLAIVRSGTRTTYEIRMPWSDLGGIDPALGTRIGFSIRVTDNDGADRIGSVTWGKGLEPWDPSSFGTLTLTNPNNVALTPPSSGPGGYAGWIAGHGLVAPANAPAADPDHDGLNNLLEYALNTSPTSGTSGRNALPPVAAGAGDALSLTFTRARAELTYRVLASSDLVTWTTLATNPGTVGSPVTVNDTNTSSAQRYLALTISDGSAFAHTMPEGRRRFTLPNGANTPVTFPLLDRWSSSFVGKSHGLITALGWNTLDNSTAGWSPGALSIAAAPSLVRIASGNATNAFFPVATGTANTATRVSVTNSSQDLRNLGIAVGTDRYEIVPADTLATLLPTGTLQSGTFSTADVLSAGELNWDGTIIQRQYYHNGTEWRRSDNTASNHVLVRPDIHYSILRRGPTTTFVLFGRAPVTLSSPTGN